GRVIRADGSGVPDVSLNVINAGGMSGTTGPDGSFTIDELAPGTVQLIALKTAEFIREMRTFEAPSSNVEIRIPPGGTIRGRVLEKGTKKPITDFRVGPSGERRGTGMRMITPPSLMPFRSEDGSFELTNVPVGPTEIAAEAGGYVSATANANVEEGKPADITILLEAGTRVFGRVTSPEGTPLAGASVSLVANEDEIVAMVTRRSTMATTDANGEYTIAGIGAGERSFRATHESYPALVKDANVSGSELRLDLQFPRGADVTGIVVRDSGEPVAGAAVSASTALQGATSKATTTDSNGNFRIEGLTPGRYTFFARTEGASETLRDVDIATSGPIRITMKTGGVVSGRVTGLQPSELSSANVNVSSASGYASASVRNDGTFRVEGAPVGNVRVVASSGTGIGSRRQTAPKAIEVTAGGETYVDLDFGSGNRVSGRVTRGGSPVGGANVIFQLKAGSSGAGGSTRTDGQGAYSIEGLEDGVYNVVVMDMTTMASHRTDYTVSGGGSFDIAMSAAALRGRVIDRETQEGISGVAVQLDSDQTSGMRFPPIQTDGSGGFRLEGVAAGNYRLRASRAGYGPETLDVSVTGDSEQDVELRMSRSDGVEIRVVDRRDGRALSAFISVADATGRLALEEYLSQSNKKLSLSPGVYRAAISVSGYAPAVADIRSPGGPFTIALSPGGSLRIDSSSAERRRARIVDSSGRPIVRGRITAPSEMTIDAAGATVTGIEPGNYTLEILDAGGGVASRHSFAIVEGQTTTLRV
ncbi:MAG TPA: carboxypeptidase regulatory-like domain-containing protein, partial [Thermoanaerobaculia bacterium]|nr:carboxypeptidase regulatory-like domain-containing protein [Thermoanaerobaculia bacterium]